MRPPRTSARGPRSIPRPTAVGSRCRTTDAEAIGYAIGTPNGEGAVEWSFEHVDGYGSDDNDVGMYSAQRTAKDGSVWVAYHDADDDTLKARHRLGGRVWEEPVVVAPGGLWASMGMVGSRPVVAHADASGQLLLSTLDDGAWVTETLYTSADTPWTLPDGSTETRDAAIGQTRVLVDDDTLYVAFHDAAKGELHLLTGETDASDAGDFDAQVLARGDVGAWPSMVVYDGDLHVAYHDLANEDLRVAVVSGGDVSLALIDDGQLVGADSEIFADDDGLGVLYFDGWNGDLLLARPSGGGWSSSRVLGDGVATGFHNETALAGGVRWVGSYDYTNHSFLFQAL